MHYRTITQVWCTAADPLWAPVLPPPTRILLRGGTWLAATPTTGACVRATLIDPYYPPMTIDIDQAAFGHGCTPVAPPAPFDLATANLCQHGAVDPACTGCWLRWWMQRAQSFGIPLPRVALIGGTL